MKPFFQRPGPLASACSDERDVHAHCLPEIPGAQREYSALVTHDKVDVIPESDIRIAKLARLAAINTKLALAGG